MADRYVPLRHRPPVRSWDEWDDGQPKRIDVITETPEPIDTGLVDANGTTLYRVKTSNPIGFVR